jgi:hypothetical protein
VAPTIGPQRRRIPLLAAVIGAGAFTVVVAVAALALSNRTSNEADFNALPTSQPAATQVRTAAPQTPASAVPTQPTRDATVASTPLTTPIATQAAVAPVAATATPSRAATATPQPVVLTATPVPTARPTAPIATATPTVAQEWDALLQTLDPLWGHDWQTLTAKAAAFVTQHPDFAPAKDKLYSARVEYAKDLIAQGSPDEAAAQLQQAQGLLPDRPEAFEAGIVLTPTPTPAPTPTPTPIPIRAPTSAPPPPRPTLAPPPPRPPTVPPIPPTKVIFNPATGGD